MYTKQVLFIVSLIILVAMFNTAWACHESDTGLRGHNPDLRFAGISVVTEAAFALTSTTTGCDHYTYFIQQSYHQIAENAAEERGISGSLCSIPWLYQRKPGTIQGPRENSLCGTLSGNRSSRKSFQQRFEEVMHRYPMLRQKCGAFSDSSLS